MNLNWNWINPLQINYLFENVDCVPVLFLTFKIGYKFSWFYRFAAMYRNCIKIAWFSLALSQMSLQQMNKLFTTIFSITKKYELVSNAFQPDWSANTRFTCFSQINGILLSQVIFLHFDFKLAIMVIVIYNSENGNLKNDLLIGWVNNK